MKSKYYPFGVTESKEVSRGASTWAGGPFSGKNLLKWVWDGLIVCQSPSQVDSWYPVPAVQLQVDSYPCPCSSSLDQWRFHKSSLSIDRTSWLIVHHLSQEGWLLYTVPTRFMIVVAFIDDGCCCQSLVFNLVLNWEMSRYWHVL